MLKREITRTNILIASAGGMIGSGWLFSPFISAQIAGSNALISWVIAAFFMLFVALPLCELGTMYPISGGMTNYPSFTHGRAVGFLFAWVSWLSYVVVTPIEIQAILQYSSHLFPALVLQANTAFGLSTFGYVLAITIMFFVVVLNSFGIKLLVECNKYASMIKFILPSIAIVTLFSKAPSMTHNITLSLSQKFDWQQIFSALSAGGIAFAFTGFQNGLMLAGEVKNPEKNLPIAILGAVFIGFLLYFLLQWSFLVAIPDLYLKLGWQHLDFPGWHGPFVGLTLLVGLTWVATLLMFDAMLSPFGSTLVYTAATSRIVYGMAVNKHLPSFLTKLNRHKIPIWALYVNFIVGAFSFLPFPGWQKMVAFLSSCSILSYGIGPICLLGLRKLKPDHPRPFKLPASYFCAHIAFYACNLMLYWCGFEILWKLCLALLLGLVLHLFYEKLAVTNPSSSQGSCDDGLHGHTIRSMAMFEMTCGPFQLKLNKGLVWFITYIVGLLLLSYLGSFGGIGWLNFPLDILILLPFSLVILTLSQLVLRLP